MPKTFKAAFDGVQNVLADKIFVIYGLLPELESRHVLSQRHISDIKVCVNYTLSINIQRK